MTDSGTAVIKNVNRSLIRSVLESKISVTKNEVARSVHLSFPTVSRIIDEMKENGEILEIGTDESTGGRRAGMYALNPAYMYILTLYLDMYSIIYEISDCIGNSVFSGRAEGAEGKYIQTIDAIIEASAANWPRLGCVSAGVPGAVENGVITFIDLYEELRNFSLKRHIESKWNIPACIENDIRAAAAGRFTAGEIADPFVCIYIGHNGPGCGIIIDGTVLRGFKGFTGELGLIHCGNTNLQDMVLTGLRDSNIPAFFSSMISAITALLNPERIIIYKNRYVSDAPLIIGWIQKKLPSGAMPDIVMADTFSQDYMNGLKKLGRNYVVPGCRITTGQQL